MIGGRRSARCRASLPQRKSRPRARRDVRRPALRPGERPSEECAPLRSGGRTVRARTRARRWASRGSGGPAPAERSHRPPGDRSMRSMSPAFFRARLCSSPGSTEFPTRPRPRGWRLPIDQRRTALSATAARLFGKLERPVIRVALPDAPGAKVMLSRLASDWGAIGIQVEQAAPGQAGGPAIDRRGRTVDFAGLVPARISLRNGRGLRPGGRRAARRRARGGDRRAAQRSADPGRATDGRRASCSSRWRLRSAGRSFRPACRASQPTASRGTL